MKSWVVLGVLVLAGCDGHEAAPEDGAVADAEGAPDADVPDAEVPDAEVPDAEVPDATPDATPDTTPPAPVTDLVARPGEWKVGLTWTNPDDPEVVGVVVRASSVAPPLDPTDGFTVYNGLGTAVVFDTFWNDVAYHATAFTFDAAGNWAASESASATPSAIWLEAPNQPEQDIGEARPVLHGGLIYLFGRYGFSPSYNLLQFDPATLTWSNCGTPSPGNGCNQGTVTRREHLAVLYGDRILAISGCVNDQCGGTGYVTQEYDPTTDTWTNCPVGGPGCSDDVVGYNRNERDTGGEVAGRVYLVGRQTTWSPPAVEEYDIATDTWTNCGGGPDATLCAPVPAAIVERDLYAISDGTLLHVFGGISPGAEAEKDDEVLHWGYDPVTNTWSELAKNPFGPRLKIAGIHDGAIWVIGDSPVLPHVQTYDLATVTWTLRAGLPGTTPLDDYPQSLSLTDDGRLIMFATGWSSEVWVYRPALDW